VFFNSYLQLVAGDDEERAGEGLSETPPPAALDLEPVDAVLEEQGEEAVVRVRGQPHARAARTGARRVVVGDEDLEARLEAHGLRNSTAVEAQALGDRPGEHQQQGSRLGRVLGSNVPDDSHGSHVVAAAMGMVPKQTDAGQQTDCLALVQLCQYLNFGGFAGQWSSGCANIFR